MKQQIFVVSALVSGWASVTQLAVAQPAQSPAFSGAVTRAAVRRVMTAAADWQLAHPSEYPLYDWTVAAFYTGMMAFSELSDSPKYYDAMKAMGERNQWRPGLRPGLADDYAVIAIYARIFQREKDKKMLAPALALFDFLVTLPFDEPLRWENGIETREWAWCDALFMAPPALAAVTTVTGDRKYLDLANRLWWKTTDYLYDTTEHLYFRDSRFFDQREPNGKKVFWSRGNGWVFAGIARVLNELPADHPDRARYVTLYREMAEKIAAVQGEDGYWRASLLDPDSRPNPETSGTGFFVYGLAWGINQGLLDRARYERVVTRGWSAMVRALHPDGMLGWVQRIGDRPGATTANTTEVYGVGALLLAGSEVYRLAK
jgi:unsaturated rhamnogalacturonyl hydrolase